MGTKLGLDVVGEALGVLVGVLDGDEEGFKVGETVVGWMVGWNVCGFKQIFQTVWLIRRETSHASTVITFFSVG